MRCEIQTLCHSIPNDEYTGITPFNKGYKYIKRVFIRKQIKLNKAVSKFFSIYLDCTGIIAIFIHSKPTLWKSIIR